MALCVYTQLAMHKCPKCGQAAYQGFHLEIECSNEECEHYSERFARSCKDTDPCLRVPTGFVEGELEDSDEGPLLCLGPTGPDDSTDELQIDWEFWDSYADDD